MKISDVFSNTPWREDGKVSFLYFTYRQNQAVAHAVNSHDALVDALELLLKLNEFEPLNDLDEQVRYNATQALIKAKGEL